MSLAADCPVLTTLARRSLPLAAVLAVPLLAAAAPAGATTLRFDLDTTALSGTAAYLAFDFIAGDDFLGNNTVVIRDFTTDATSLGTAVTTGTVSGDLPGLVTLTDSGFSELLQPLTLGNAVHFTLDLTEHRATGPLPDAFSFFLLDSVYSPLFSTDDPTGGGTLFAVDITGTPSGTRYRYVYTDTGTPVTWTLNPVAAPEPSTMLLFGAGLLGWMTHRRRRQASSAPVER